MVKRQLVHESNGEVRELTLISLCSKNCKMTFLKYSRLTSSSFLEWEVGPGEVVLDNDEESCKVGDGDDSRVSEGFSCRAKELQYPTPGLRCLSRSAAELCTFRNSSRTLLERMRCWKRFSKSLMKTTSIPCWRP